MIIAIDGPAASGKGTLAKKLAAHYGFRHLDTGLLYRAVALAVLSAGHKPTERDKAIAAAKTIDPATFDETALKRYDVGEAASVVSAVPEVRAALFDLQQNFAKAPPGAVLDGRDIGRVICPNAEVKIFVTASPEVRAYRRTMELRGRGENADEKAVLADILARDERDRSRSAAPRVQAADAHLLDTSALDIEGSFKAALALVEKARKRP
jgi:CMP/dCMP kinase